jgi:hypothetical protein
MTLQLMPIDTTRLEFRYHGASEYFEYDRDTNKRSGEQARHTDTGYPIYTVRCQVLYRDQRQAGMIAIRVPLAEPPAEDIEFEAPVVFGGVDSRPWNMEGRDGQTWTAESMAFVGPGKPATPPAPATGSGKAKAPAAASS